jgi:CheY-like chemotaxis protein/nitrogen-specific signal transduction histidine kinase
MIVCRDITDRKHAESELIRSKEKAEESDRLKTAFLHNISHEIRTPMNAIIGFSAMLSEPDLDRASQNSYVDIISQSSNHLLSIVSDIIEISNIEAGILKLSLKKTNINDVATDLHNQFMARATEKNIDLSINAEFKNGESQIWTDVAKLTQVISCLLSNALKFTAAGKITMGYRLNGSYIECFVRDTGIGISKDQFTKIFERFYQVENTISRQYEGTGLGLSIAKAYVELLGGKIWLTSEPGSGTTFMFTIPYLAAEPTLKEDNKTVINDDLKKYENKTVLIAEDEENNFRLVVEFLTGLNLKIIRAENGKEAVDICDSGEDIDLVLMDIKMPVMDGLEATKLLKRKRRLLPVIAQTAFTFESDREKIIGAGCDDYISKPIKKDLLIAMVKKYL